MKWFQTLKVKMTWRITLGMLLLSVVVSILAGMIFYSYLRDSYENQMQNLNKNIEKTSIYAYSYQENLIQFISKTDTIRYALYSEDFEGVTSFFEKLQKDTGIYENVFISTADKNPRVIAASVRAAQGLAWRLPENAENIEASLAGRVYVSRPHKSPVTGIPAVLITAPVFQNNTVVAIIGLAIDYSKFIQPILENTKIGQSGFPFISNYEGIILAHPNREFVLKKKIQDIGLNLEILDSSSDTGIKFLEFEGKSMLFSYLKDKKYGHLIICSFDLEEVLYGARYLGTLLFLILLATNFTLSLFVYFYINSKLKLLEESRLKANDMASGKLVLIEKENLKSDDEVGEMFRAMNALSRSFRSTIEEISLAAKSIRESSGILSERMNEFSGSFSAQSNISSDAYSSLSELNREMEAVSNEAREQSSMLEDLVQRLGNLSNKIRETGDHIDHAITAVKEISSRVDQSKTSIKSMEESMQSIGRSSVEVKKIIRIIEEISKKTNLLALNAAIEAARAGDHGLGFTVVAGEVAKLADETKKSVTGISQKITENEEQIRAGVDKVNNSTSLFNQILEGVKKLESYVNSINKSMLSQIKSNEEVNQKLKNARTKSEEMRSATEKQKKETSKIHDSIESMNRSTRENSGLVTKIAEQSKELDEIAQKLESKVEYFTL